MKPEVFEPEAPEARSLKPVAPEARSPEPGA